MNIWERRRDEIAPSKRSVYVDTLPAYGSALEVLRLTN
jgi:hypothetical protein